MRETVIAILGGMETSHARMAPLLNPVLPFAFEETNETIELSDDSRSDTLHAMLCYLFDALCPETFKMGGRRAASTVRPPELRAVRSPHSCPAGHAVFMARPTLAACATRRSLSRIPHRRQSCSKMRTTSTLRRGLSSAL